MSTFSFCQCGFDRAKNDPIVQDTGSEVHIPPDAPGQRAVLRACRDCRAVYVVTRDEDQQLPGFNLQLDRKPRPSSCPECGVSWTDQVSR